jgi:hypothetical protein
LPSFNLGVKFLEGVKEQTHGNSGRLFFSWGFYLGGRPVKNMNLKWFPFLPLEYVSPYKKENKKMYNTS